MIKLEFEDLSEKAKFWAIVLGYAGVAMAFTYACYKMFALMVGKAVAAELVKAGVIAVAL